MAITKWFILHNIQLKLASSDKPFLSSGHITLCSLISLLPSPLTLLCKAIFIVLR